MGRPFTQEPVTESSVPESTGNESTGNESDYTSIRIVSDAQTSDPEDTDIPPSSIETDKGFQIRPRAMSLRMTHLWMVRMKYNLMKSILLNLS